MLDGTSADVDGNLEPDECQCLMDLYGSGIVDVVDVLIVIARWGETGPEGDVDADGHVGVADLLLVLDAWGPCEH